MEKNYATLDDLKLELALRRMKCPLYYNINGKRFYIKELDDSDLEYLIRRIEERMH